MSTSKTAPAQVERPMGRLVRGGVGQSRRNTRRILRPYLFIAPAAIFELFIHILTMLIGVVISLLGLTLFYIPYWNEAPFIGLQNYVIALNFGGAAGGALLHSFCITIAYTLVVAGSWVLGMAAALLLNGEFRGRNWFRTITQQHGPSVAVPAVQGVLSALLARFSF